MNTAKNVKIIPATLNLFTSAPKLFPDKRKVAAYARVSTDKEEQVTSYEAQVDYYTRYIKSRQDWEFVDIYTDEGISATSTKKRDGFNRMIQDALDGKIDLIVTKSVSRFARNTVDTLTTVRKLKDKGVEVYFEKENIYTLDSKGELLITIMGSLAQEESRSISENTTWGRRKRFADGKVTMAYKRFLWYEKGEDGAPKVVEKEAKIVKLIYQMFLEGKSIRNIAATLTKQKIPTPANKVKWSVSTITSILKNEKYKGDALLQKSYTTDFLTKKIKKNEGEVPQYYVEHSHPEIISREIFDMVQQEFKKREGIKNRSGSNMFSSKIVCGDCGNFYGSKVWHSNDKYRRIIWRCNHKYKNEKRCQTPIIREVQIKEKFVDVINRLIQDKPKVVSDCENIIEKLCDMSSIENKELKLRAEQNVLYNSMQKLIEENSKIQLDQKKYNNQYESLRVQYEKNTEKLNKLENTRLEWKVKKQQTLEFLEKIKNQNNLITDFDEHMWYALVEKVIVNRAGSLKFELKNGQILRLNK